MGLSAKLLMFGALVLLLLTTALLWPTRAAMREQVIEDIQNQLAAIAATAALQIDGDMHAAVLHEPLPTPSDANEQDAKPSAFTMLQEKLRNVRDANGLGTKADGTPTDEYLYTFSFAPDASLLFTVMTHGPDDLFVGNPYDLHTHHAVAVQTGRVAASELYMDDYGEWISAAAPIRNVAGSITGLLEVTQPAEVYFGRYERLLWTNTLIALGTLFAAALLGYWLLRRTVLGPIHQVTRGMEALGRREFSHRVDIRTRDEFQRLGQTLNSLFGQLDAAKVVQAGFVPDSVPTGEGYSVAVKSEPCDATGGDYVDAFQLQDGRVAILIADVTGHGLGPSLVMASCRAALRALAHIDLSPSELVYKLEQLLEDDLTEGKFITMVYGVLEPDGTFTYCNAGHAPALLRRDHPDGPNGAKVQALPAHRPPLGVVIPKTEGEAYETRIELREGDRILLTSDGVNEAMNPESELLGIEPMQSLLQDRGLTTSEALVDRLCETVRSHRSGRPADDDVAILCVDRLAVTS
ncbi:MAG: SpoIIE family protein phosphatase [Planctomycetota bacterium]